MFAVAQSIAIRDDVHHNVGRHVRFITAAAEHGAQMILFPELSLTGYHHDFTLNDAIAADDKRLDPLRAVVEQQKIVAIAGMPVALSDGLGIGALVIAPGDVSSVYAKEYLHEGEEVAFVPGSGGPLVLVDREVVGLAICADMTHPEHACAAADSGATVYAASCFITEAGYAADTELLRRYAVEHQMLVLMANYGEPTPDYSCAGKSAVWSAQGTLLACAPETGEWLCVVDRLEGEWVGKVVQI